MLLVQDINFLTIIFLPDIIALNYFFRQAGLAFTFTYPNETLIILFQINFSLMKGSFYG